MLVGEEDAGLVAGAGLRVFTLLLGIGFITADGLGVGVGIYCSGLTKGGGT